MRCHLSIKGPVTTVKKMRVPSEDFFLLVFVCFYRSNVLFFMILPSFVSPDTLFSIVTDVWDSICKRYLEDSIGVVLGINPFPNIVKTFSPNTRT